MKELFYKAIDEKKEMLLSAERHIWQNPESGYREWKTHAFLKEKYEELGYKVVEAGNIPGFYVDIDTGRPGPKVGIFGEMDSLIIEGHPECDKETHAVHACGHHCQSVALLAVAVALANPGALDDLCGSVRLFAVPAEEGIEIEYREKLAEDGIISYIAGKVEFMHRGFLDGVDMAIMIHTNSSEKYDITFGKGNIGCIAMNCTFKGVSAHAGGSPYKGKNALYAATNALSVTNALRETFRDEDHMRFHPIITKGGDAVNAIPCEVKMESYVRGATLEAISRESKKINCALACSAAAMGCEAVIHDMHYAAPRFDDANLRAVFEEAAHDIFPADRIITDTSVLGTGCTDMGDVGSVMPVCHPHVAGATGRAHTDEFYISDAEKFVIGGAKVECGVIDRLLSDNAVRAKKIIAEKKPIFNSIEDYFKAVDSMNKKIDAVRFEENGDIKIVLD